MNKLKQLLIVLVCLGSITTNAQKVFNVINHGAAGDGKTDDAIAIQKTIDACAAAGGGQVLFPASHVYLSGPIQLKSNINLHLEAGAVLLANPDEKIYTKSAFRDNPGEGTIWIGGEKLENVMLSGLGEINGNGISFMGAELEDSYVLKPFNIMDPRPHVITIIGGKNIRIHDLKIGNAAYWTIHLIGCDDVVISGLTLLNSLKVRNSDGIDLDHSRNVRISDCYIESGDDCICLKNRREYEEFGNCENITVTNCTMTSRSCAIKIGSENMDTIRQVLFNNCIIKNSNRGVGIQNRDEGVVSDVIFSNMIIEGHLFSDVWWGKAEPIYITAYRRAKINHKDANWRFPKGATEGRVGQVKNIYFNNISCSSENGVYVSAESPDKIDNIVFDNIDLLINKTTDVPGGIYDRRPADVEGFVKGSTSGFYFENAESIRVRNSHLRWGPQKAPYFNFVVESKKVKALELFNVTGSAAFSQKSKTKITR
ncbi:MAG: right-handed parallel beta-helix repeat-containing protein [Chitinophagaceae bacterium]|nr:right-handed parallel beta-helix repeat-containing protein [Chitinophagaceae bacterium]MBP6589684.1 right-handed parallel beta-helix repeat-containing protein [Chitinophagaceae bacterium]MBP8243154.1 right-handed parallel beta-helix repeat-containing protein [Chitinophagaceae bacterium]